MSIYLSIDPGKATGIAWLTGEGGGPYIFKSTIMDGPRYNVESFVAGMCHKYTGQNELVVIIESWEVRKNTHLLSAQEDPRYILGAVEYLCGEWEIPYHEQSAGLMKSFSNRPVEYHKVRRLGWHKPGDGHDNDAAGHLVTFLAKDKSPAGDWMRARLEEVLF